MKTLSRIDTISRRDKLWELYLHTLAGYHGNEGANQSGSDRIISENAMVSAKAALAVWEETHGQ